VPKHNPIASAIVVALFVVACSANEPAGNLSTPTPDISNPPAASVAPTDPAASSEPSPPSSYGVGDRIKIGDEEFFAVSEVDLAVPGTEFIGPAAGQKWIAALAEIEGINPDGASYNPFFFKVRDEQGFEYNYNAFGKEPQLQSSNDLQPGQTIKGWVTFEVPDTAQTFTLVYTVFFNDSVEVVLN
jgi:hypothetical protein